MKILKYIAIESQDSFNEALSRINRHVRSNQFVAREVPQTLTGNFKILRLVAKSDSSIFVKVDGPGFIIDKLFDHFTEN